MNLNGIPISSPGASDRGSLRPLRRPSEKDRRCAARDHESHPKAERAIMLSHDQIDTLRQTKAAGRVECNLSKPGASRRP
jgi:hypothetical protein